MQAFVLVLVAALAVSGGAAAAEAVDVEPTGDAEGSFVAVSGTGNATCAEAALAPCVAASGTGNATTCDDWFIPFRCVAASGAGNSSGGVAASVSRNASGYYALALIGDASCAGGYDPCLAVSGTGHAEAKGFGIAVSACDAAGLCWSPPDALLP